MLATIIFFIFGLGALIKGANLLIDGSVALAEKLRISPLIIGLTIVAFGTSAPELAVNVISALGPATSDIGLGNIIGSNITNIGLILGIAALLAPLRIKKVTLSRELPFLILSSLIFLVLVSDHLLGRQSGNALTRGDGFILLAFFLIFLYYLVGSVLRERREGLEHEYAKEYHPRKNIPLWHLLAFLTIGLVGLTLGGKLVVDNAVTIARALGLSEILIGLTIVAVGTSLPELAASATAAFKREPDIAIGNVVGSNIFNTFSILGINAAISPVPFRHQWFPDALIMIFFSVLLFLLSYTGRQIKRREGVVMIAAYCAYLVFIIFRG